MWEMWGTVGRKPPTPLPPIGAEQMESGGCLCSSTRKDVIQNEQQNGPQHRHQESGAFALPVQAKSPADESAEQRARYADQDGNHESPGIPAGVQQFGDQTNDQAENNPADDSEHVEPPVLHHAATHLPPQPISRFPQRSMS